MVIVYTLTVCIRLIQLLIISNEFYNLYLGMGRVALCPHHFVDAAIHTETSSTKGNTPILTFFL